MVGRGPKMYKRENPNRSFICVLTVEFLIQCDRWICILFNLTSIFFNVGFGLDLYICNALIDMYARLCALDKARQVFDEMPKRDVISWNSLVIVPMSKWEEALQVFYQSRKTYAFCGGDKFFEQYEKLLEVLATLIAKEGYVANLRSVLHMMLKKMRTEKFFVDIACHCIWIIEYKTWSTVAGNEEFTETPIGFISSRMDHVVVVIVGEDKLPASMDWIEGLKLIVDLEGFSRKVQKTVLNLLLRCYLEQSVLAIIDWKIPLMLYLQRNFCNELVVEVEKFSSFRFEDVLINNVILTGYIENRDTKSLWKLFIAMSKLDVASWILATKDIIAWTVLIQGHLRNNLIKEARKVFDEMPHPDTVAWNSRINGYIKMPKRKVVSWNTILQGYAQDHDMLKAWMLFDKIHNKDSNHLEYNDLWVIFVFKRPNASKWMNTPLDLSIHVT
ncbi:LOW QUALITY PROTEIN: hypothetical protein OSB04_013218 [Centaurea solstitialis]|uniref:Pentatricopeptide repeat-containing protein n=1 Tax=Centaurea solstitialis TaxID=347529 RepID=A0AA38WQH4_9ASTR|nr:LOW QUALITY PROTEIN: hypothetical protein OSB04_013218 [Centaurea solstitialis]